MQVTILQAKNKAIQLRDILQAVKIKTKEQKKLLKLLNEFINCHASNDAIHKKYGMLKSMLIQIEENENKQY